MAKKQTELTTAEQRLAKLVSRKDELGAQLERQYARLKRAWNRYEETMRRLKYATRMIEKREKEIANGG